MSSIRSLQLTLLLTTLVRRNGTAAFLSAFDSRPSSSAAAPQSSSLPSPPLPLRSIPQRTSLRHLAKARQNTNRRSSSESAEPSCPNNLLGLTQLRNQFYALRHGQSTANVAGLIAASPELAEDDYGLSEVGCRQADAAGQALVRVFQSASYRSVVLLSSDLLRARQTAQAVADAVRQAAIPLHRDRVIVDQRLRERGFGAYDGKDDSNYHNVWKDDAVDPTHSVNGVEPVTSVMYRATQCVAEWNAALDNHLVVCVAHGDVLQILQTAFCKLDGSKHRTLDHLETAVLRKLELTNDPPAVPRTRV